MDFFFLLNLLLFFATFSNCAVVNREGSQQIELIKDEETDQLVPEKDTVVHTEDETLEFEAPCESALTLDDVNEDKPALPFTTKQKRCPSVGSIHNPKFASLSASKFYSPYDSVVGMSQPQKLTKTNNNATVSFRIKMCEICRKQNCKDKENCDECKTPCSKVPDISQNDKSSNGQIMENTEVPTMQSRFGDDEILGSPTPIKKVFHLATLTNGSVKKLILKMIGVSDVSDVETVMIFVTTRSNEIPKISGSQNPTTNTPPDAKKLENSLNDAMAKKGDQNQHLNHDDIQTVLDDIPREENEKLKQFRVFPQFDLPKNINEVSEDTRKNPDVIEGPMDSDLLGSEKKETENKTKAAVREDEEENQEEEFVPENDDETEDNEKMRSRKKIMKKTHGPYVNKPKNNVEKSEEIEEKNNPVTLKQNEIEEDDDDRMRTHHKKKQKDHTGYGGHFYRENIEAENGIPSTENDDDKMRTHHNKKQKGHMGHGGHFYRQNIENENISSTDNESGNNNLGTPQFGENIIEPTTKEKTNEVPEIDHRGRLLSRDNFENEETETTPLTIKSSETDDTNQLDDRMRTHHRIKMKKKGHFGPGQYYRENDENIGSPLEQKPIVEPEGLDDSDESKELTQTDFNNNDLETTTIDPGTKTIIPTLLDKIKPRIAAQREKVMQQLDQLKAKFAHPKVDQPVEKNKEDMTNVEKEKNIVGQSEEPQNALKFGQNVLENVSKNSGINGFKEATEILENVQDIVKNMQESVGPHQKDILGHQNENDAVNLSKIPDRRQESSTGPENVEKPSKNIETLSSPPANTFTAFDERKTPQESINPPSFISQAVHPNTTDKIFRSMKTVPEYFINRAHDALNMINNKDDPPNGHVRDEHSEMTQDIIKNIKKMPQHLLHKLQETLGHLNENPEGINKVEEGSIVGGPKGLPVTPFSWPPVKPTPTMKKPPVVGLKSRLQKALDDIKLKQTQKKMELEQLLRQQELEMKQKGFNLGIGQPSTTDKSEDSRNFGNGQPEIKINYIKAATTEGTVGEQNLVTELENNALDPFKHVPKEEFGHSSHGETSQTTQKDPEVVKIMDTRVGEPNREAELTDNALDVPNHFPEGNIFKNIPIKNKKIFGHSPHGNLEETSETTQKNIEENVGTEVPNDNTLEVPSNHFPEGNIFENIPIKNKEIFGHSPLGNLEGASETTTMNIEETVGGIHDESPPKVETRGEFEKDGSSSSEEWTPSLGKIVRESSKPSDVFFLGNGIKLPLKMSKTDDGSVNLQVDLDRLCGCKNTTTCLKQHANISETVGAILEKEAELKEQIKEVSKEEDALGINSAESPEKAVERKGRHVVANRFKIRDFGRLRSGPRKYMLIKRSTKHFNPLEGTTPLKQNKNYDKDNSFRYSTRDKNEADKILEKATPFLTQLEKTSESLNDRLKLHAQSFLQQINKLPVEEERKTFEDNMQKSLEKLKNVPNILSRNWFDKSYEEVPSGRRFKKLEEDLEKKLEKIDENVEKYHDKNEKLFKDDYNKIFKLREDKVVNKEVDLLTKFISWLKSLTSSRK